MTETTDKLIKLAGVSVTVAAAAALAYYLLKHDDGESGRVAGGSGNNADKVLKILSEIQKSQDKMKQVMKTLTQQLIQGNKTFAETYHLVNTSSFKF